MRKAASHKVGYFTLAMIVAVVAMFASVARASAYVPDLNEVPVGDQDINDNVIGFITIEGTHAKATVENIGGATESGGLASYTKTVGDTEEQTLFASTSFTLEPYSKKDLVIELPCFAQVDLYKGDLIQSFVNGARYGSRLVYAIHTKDECVATSTPSATPNETPESTPSETPGQGGGNPTPTPTSTPETTPSASPGSPTSTPAPSDTPSNNNGGSTSGTVLGTSTPAQGGLTLPSTGGSNFDYLALAAYVLSAGITLRKYAKVLDAA